jgi:3-deoxy-D-manno-octulosonic-acid transferase
MKNRLRRGNRTAHHIKSQSRFPKLAKDDTNIKYVPIDFHVAYHRLFDIMTPEEVIEYLNDVWFTANNFIRPTQWLKERGLCHTG